MVVHPAAPSVEPRPHLDIYLTQDTPTGCAATSTTSSSPKSRRRPAITSRRGKRRSPSPLPKQP